MLVVLAVWAGYYLDHTVLPNASIPAYVQDTLNELEFLMGPADSEYGSLRASLGYPDPWVRTPVVQIHQRAISKSCSHLGIPVIGVLAIMGMKVALAIYLLRD